MTLAQSKAFVMKALALHTPAYFSEEALVYIHSQGCFDGKYIRWHGTVYTVTKVHQFTRIVEAIRTPKRLQPIRGLEPEPLSMRITDQAWRAVPEAVSLEYVRSLLDQMLKGQNRRRCLRVEAPQIAPQGGYS